MTTRSRLVSITIVCLLSVVLLAATGTWVFAAGEETLSAEAMNNLKAQIELLNKEKQSLTAVQRKVNPSIIRHLHVKVLQDRKEVFPKLQSTIALNDKNEILTDIKANVSDAVLKMITGNGGTIINQFPQYRAIRALIPITAVEVIAAHPDIKFIDRAALCETRRTISEGDVAHNAPLVRAKGFTGAGVKVGVLSDSVTGPSGVDFLTPLKASGDLPATVTVLEDILPPDYGSGEGAAMLEIVYDLAPNSPLYFASAFNGAASFANNIKALASAGCKVIVDDVGYFDESPFQDDIISQAVSTVTAAGVSYFSSAGNSRSLASGLSGTWEGDYVPGVTWVYSGYTYQLHEFAPGVTTNRIIENPGVITLFWSDALGASANDYDLFVVDSAGNVVNKSWYIQNGNDNPYEFIGVSGDYTNLYIVIGKYSGSGRFLHLNASRGRTQYATNGETHGHATVESAFCVSAVSAYLRTTPFTGAEPLEWFTSDGPRRVFYYPDGTPITPGNFSSTGGYVRKKPDITAADGVLCSTPGFEHFYGTSAAAPHAAAITALLLSAKPNATAAQIRKALTESALPAPATWDDVSGYGIVMADLALKLLSGGIDPPYLLMLLD